MAHFCKYCGKELNENEKHNCPKKPDGKDWLERLYMKLEPILLWIINLIGVGRVGNVNECFERGKGIVPDSIEMNEGETPIKQYDAAVLRTRLKLERSEGRLQVTNKRLLFRSNGYSLFGKTTYQHEFAIDKIDGVTVRKDHRFRFLDLILNILLMGWLYLVAIVPFAIGASLSEASVFLGVLTSLFAVCFFIPFFVMKRHFYIKMFSAAIGNGLLLGQALRFSTDDKTFLCVVAVLLLALGTSIMYASLFLCCLKPNLLIEVKCAGTPAVQIKHQYSSFIWHKSEENSGFDEIMPGKDTDVMIQELGAMIDDIKTLGDLAVEKWKEKE